MQRVILSVVAIILSVILFRVNALTVEERDAERADALFTKKESHQVLTAEETKWYADYIKKCVAMQEKDKIIAPQLVSVASNIASKVLYAPKGQSAVRKVTASLQVAGPAMDKYRITVQYKSSSGFTANGTKKAILINSVKVMKELVSAPELKEVEAFEINGLAGGTDQYGRNTEFNLVSITMLVWMAGANHARNLYDQDRHPRLGALDIGRLDRTGCRPSLMAQEESSGNGGRAVL